MELTHILGLETSVRMYHLISGFLENEKIIYEIFSKEITIIKCSVYSDSLFLSLFHCCLAGSNLQVKHLLELTYRNCVKMC